MTITDERNSNIIDGFTLILSLALLLAAAAGAQYTGTWNTILRDFYHILTTPGPLITDYFGVGSMPAAFLNAGLCGLAMFMFMHFLPGPSHVNTLAGYFLVIAHAFYGLNFLNMWPCFLAPFLYLYIRRLDSNENLHVCMFSTCFSPFVSELLFRYSLEGSYIPGKVQLTAEGVVLTLCLVLILAFVAPALLPGARAWHKGYNLYNGGLAYGMLAFFMYNFLYRTVGMEAPSVPVFINDVYESFFRSYRSFGNVFFSLLFFGCILAGYLLNGRSFRGIRALLHDTGYQSNFAKRYGMPVCLINIGLYGLLFLIYINLAILNSVGAGFTGPTFGVIFAALTFTAMGQHPLNVWPIFLGFPLLSFCSSMYNHVIGGHAAWTISTQAYINSIAFATGLCPIAGRYGAAAGIAAGFLCASLCRATGSLHGGLMLYNGGFTAGITALILVPILEHYLKTPRDSMPHPFDPDASMSVNEEAKRKPR